ncbi:MAG TPA: GNAT family N-acetyltransferase [Roseiflexaceae bacterium]|nr:GNAT family N-acetyltransferase [Roseiflexaceae bacterium]
MKTITFRRLAPTELEAAYAIVREVARWLQHSDLPAWLVPLDIYEQRQHQGENYGLLVDDLLCAVVTLTCYRPTSWAEYLPDTNFIWLATLASKRQFKGHHLGRLLLAQAERFVQQQGIQSIYLDCYYSRGLLPHYYEQLGYNWIVRKDLLFDDGSVHDSVLMSKMVTLPSND